MKTRYIGDKKFYRPDWDWSISDHKAVNLIANAVRQVETIPDEFDKDFGSPISPVCILTGEIRVEIKGRPEHNEYIVGLWKPHKYAIWVLVSKSSYPALFEYIRGLHIDECEDDWG